ncbi:MAG: TPR end-of-group domain-containing protein [Phycisphaerales bacterium]
MPPALFGRRFTLLCFVLLILLLALSTAALAQNDPPDSAPPTRRERIEQLDASWPKAFEARDYGTAEKQLRELIELSPQDFLPWYNLACVQCQMQQYANANKSLQRAIDLGFADFATLEADETLAALRDTEQFKGILAQAARLQNNTIDKRIERYRSGFAKKYAVDKDEPLRLAYMSDLNPQALASARSEITRLAAWWAKDVAPGAPEPNRPHPWVLVMLPNRKDYMTWAVKNFGDGAESKGGIYDHDKKELVARDLGPTLRHEFFHVLHWRDMAARRVIHPIWVQEGLCSLVEDIQWLPDGTAKGLPSYRTNMLKRLMLSSKLPAWSDFFALTPQKFASGKPLLNYAVGRSIFLFLQDRGKLSAWYTALNATLKDDPTGAKAFEVVFNEPLAKTELAWKNWLKDLPMVGDANTPTGTVLPFTVNEGGGDGVTVGVISASNEKASGLRSRDVISSINDQGTHDLNEVTRILSALKPGDEVTITYRRGKMLGQTKVKLVQKE